MNTREATYPSRKSAGLNRRVKSLGELMLVGLLGWAITLSASAQNVVERVDINPGADGQVNISITLNQAPIDPRLFTTDSPPRIAVDFDNTRSGLAERRITSGLGAANAVTVIEAAGRTRVVIELSKATPYTQNLQGNVLTVTLQGSISESTAARGASNRPAISNIDFRRGKNGEGRVVITFSQEGTSAELRREGSRVFVDVFDVELPSNLNERLDVLDFATPVEIVETKPRGNGARTELRMHTDFVQLAYQSGKEYIVEIAPVKQESAAALALKEPEYKGQKITFNFQDIAVRSLLQMIADVSEVNVVVADTVTGNLTMRLDSVPWDHALDIILQAKGLDKRRRGNVIWVAPAAEIAVREQALEDARIAIEDRSPLISEYIPINYAKAKNIADLLTKDAQKGESSGGGGSGQKGQATLRSGFLSVRGSVTFDERTNTLLLNDTAAKVDEIKTLIVLLDRPVDQVLIEARIVVATEDFSRDIGARFGVSSGYEDSHGNLITTSGSQFGTDEMLNRGVINRQALGSRSSLPVVFPGDLPTEPAPGLEGGLALPNLFDRLNVNLPVANAAGSFGLAILTADYLLDLELSAMESDGRGEVVSAPRVITSNQSEATIKQGTEFGFSRVVTSITGSVVTTEFKEAVLELKVTPTITQDMRVFMELAVKKDALAGSFQGIPIIDTREVNTGVLINNGQTVVLGGIYEMAKQESKQKVPLLGDIPALGVLFRNTSKSNIKGELMIFVTPKILEQRAP